MRRWTPAIVFAAALAVRIAIVIQLHASTALFRTPQLDSFEYHSWAQRIASGDFSWPAAPPHGPGYPLFLGMLLAIGHGSVLFAHVAQAFLGAITAVVISAIARRTAGHVAALIAGLAAAIYAPLALIEVSIYAEGLLVFLLSGSILAVIEPKRPLLMSFLAGTALGLAIIVRPTAAILVPIYLVYVWRRMPRAAILFALATAYPVLPVMLQNWSATGDFLAIQSSGGLNLYIGNARDHDGTAWARPGGSWDWLRGEAWRAGIRGAAAEDRYYAHRALAEMRPSLVAKKLFWLLQNDEIRDSHSFDFFTERSALLRYAPRFGLLLPFAILGMFAMPRSSSKWLLIACAIAMSITIVALVVGMRYRMPLIPLLFVFAGAGAVALRDRRAWMRFAVVAIITLATTFAWRHAPTHNVGEEWAMEGIALGKEGRFDEATSAFQHALSLNARSAIGWTGLGDLALRRGNLTEAERLYGHSLDVDPRHALTYTHLALARAAAGDRASAIEMLRRALSIRADRDAMYTLAGFLFADRDIDGAERWLRELLRMNPSDSQAQIALERTRAARFHH
ncbi:MAG TPA: tetratricopeptide repeat protein [Thermoanaerobaculia bacterium]|nr:tetratricopeptide repeat protein [Thermoanaerobaculia bacterium]